VALMTADTLLDAALAAWLADIDSVPMPDLTTLTPEGQDR
jgi:hypothetical protein